VDENGCCARLRLSFDPELLKRDLESLKRVRRIRQPGSYHDGEWAGISLRSAGGTESARPSLPSFAPFEHSPLLQRTPYFRKVLRTLRVPQLTVRLLSLPPAGVIREHTDDIFGFWHGLLRLHLPIVTHPDVRFTIGGRRCHWAPGEIWYGDFSQKHSVVNESPITRVHMVIDVLINKFLLDLFPAGFVETHIGDGITRYRRPLAARGPELKRYACEFGVPPELVSMFAPVLKFDASPSVKSLVDEASRTGVLARIGVAKDRLYLTACGRTLLHLVPIAKETCALAEWPAGIMLHFERRGENIRGLKLELRLQRGSASSPRNLIPLAVLAS
jgi:Aspartyl/Asparaginyl beta-hydroxylase